MRHHRLRPGPLGHPSPRSRSGRRREAFLQPCRRRTPAGACHRSLGMASPRSLPRARDRTLRAAARSVQARSTSRGLNKTRETTCRAERQGGRRNDSGLNSNRRRAIARNPWQLWRRRRPKSPGRQLSTIQPPSVVSPAPPWPPFARGRPPLRQRRRRLPHLPRLGIRRGGSAARRRPFPGRHGRHRDGRPSGCASRPRRPPPTGWRRQPLRHVAIGLLLLLPRQPSAHGRRRPAPRRRKRRAATAAARLAGGRPATLAAARAARWRRRTVQGPQQRPGSLKPRRP
mmetsp:Transcript_15415/g.43814  ORF Transcript_15415/g.43814 Transcript_15415/m.43814 type:complete len:286 (+) Transcript_15415:216-1073(+)